MESPSCLEIRTGRIDALGAVRTAYAKAPRHGPVAAGPLGLEGDEQADRKHHGGPDKAVYVYAADAYAWWRAARPEHAAKLAAGGFGENLVVAGLDEEGVFVGDRWRVGTALLEACQIRQPCHVLSRWFDDPSMVRTFIESHRCGWYLRVVEPGVMRAGDAMRLEERLAGNWTIARLSRVAHAKRIDPEDLRSMVAMERLADHWRDWALARLARLAA